MPRILSVYLVLTLLSMLAHAHEGWMEADKFYCKTGENVNLHFRLGQDFIGEKWAIKPDQLTRIQHHSG